METWFIIQLLVGYSFIGGGLKYIDQAYDINAFPKRIASLMAIPIALVMSYLSIIDAYSAAIFISLIAGMIIIQRVDNIVFISGAALVIGLFLLFGDLSAFNWILFSILLVSQSLEEIISDYDERKKFNGIKHFLMHYGVQIKLVIFALVLLGYIDIIYFIAFFFLDFFYLAVEQYSLKGVDKHYG